MMTSSLPCCWVLSRIPYSMGVYRWCLLSAFDSNKKVLYATLNGRIVGRAFLRLTKGRLTGTGATEQRFTFVDLEDVEGSRHSPVSGQEYLTLIFDTIFGTALHQPCGTGNGEADQAGLYRTHPAKIGGAGCSACP